MATINAIKTGITSKTMNMYDDISGRARRCRILISKRGAW